MKNFLLITLTIALIAFSIKSIFLDDFNQDGIYLKLSIEEKLSQQQKLNAFAIRIRAQLDRGNIVYTNLKIDDNKIFFKFLDEDDSFKVREIVNTYTSVFDIELNERGYSFSFLSEYLKKEKDGLLEKSKQVLERRLERMGLYHGLFDVFLRNTTKVKLSDNRFIEISIPKLCSKCSEEKVKHILGSVGYFTLMSVDDKDTLLKDSIPILDSSFLKKVSVTFDNDRPQLMIALNEEGKRILADYTAINIMKKIAILVDGKVYSISRIIEAISIGSFVVTLEELNPQELHDLTIMIGNHPLPSSLGVEEMYRIVEK